MAIRFWARSSRHRRFSTTCLDTKASCQLISHRQAPLTFPFIAKWLHLRAQGRTGVYKRHATQFSSIRDYFLAFADSSPPWASFPPVFFSQYGAWHMLYRLTLPTRQSETSASLRSGRFHVWEIYSMYRISQRLEEPYRTTAKKSVASAMKFRNNTQSTRNSPVSLPFLADTSFSSSLT